MLQFNPISINKLAVLFLFALLIFIANKLINLLIRKWAKKEAQQSLLSVYLPITINFIWIFFFLYSIYELALINPVLSIFITSIVLFTTWNYINDFVQGTLFKVRKGNLVGQLIKLNDYSGEVVKMKNTRLHLQLENGQIVEYPYSKLSNAIIAISTNVENYKNSSLSISVPFTNEIEETKIQLRIQLFNIPWIATNKNIKIETVHKDSGKIDFKINFYTLDEKFVPKIQQALNMLKFD